MEVWKSPPPWKPRPHTHPHEFTPLYDYLLHIMILAASTII